MVEQLFIKLVAAPLSERLVKALAEGIRKKWKPSKVQELLEKAVCAAHEEVPTLFRKYQRGGPTGISSLLNRFFNEEIICLELQKPLENKSKPDTSLLIKELIEETETKKRPSLEKELAQSWMNCFVETYFEGTRLASQYRNYLIQYCKEIELEHKDIKFIGIDAVIDMDTDRDADEPFRGLAQIFVSPSFDLVKLHSKSVTGESSSNALATYGQHEINSLYITKPQFQQQLYAPFSSPYSDGDPFSLFFNQVALDEDREKFACLMLTGKPGSGKTTLMSYYAVAIARQTLIAHQTVPSTPAAYENNPLQVSLPVLVRIREFEVVSDKSSVFDFVKNSTQESLGLESLPGGFFESYLSSGDALILFDGLDEATSSQRQKIIDKIGKFVDNFPMCRVAITSRPAGYKGNYFGRIKLDEYEIQDFNQAQIEKFIDNWYESRLQSSRENERNRQKDDLRNALSNQKQIRELAENPLLLTIIVLIHRYCDLPKDRCQLYQKAVETLLRTWDKKRHISNGNNLKHIEPEHYLELMRKLAYWIHSKGIGSDAESNTLIDRSELISQMTKDISEVTGENKGRSEAEANRFLDSVVTERAGLLSLQRGERYGFVHKTFQEYLTAMEINARKDDNHKEVENHIEDHLIDPHWEEVLLILIAQQQGRRPTKILQFVKNMNSPYEKWLHRDLLFAGRMLCEKISIRDNNLVSAILEELIGLEVSQSPSCTEELRAQVFQVITNLSEPSSRKTAIAKIKNHERKFNDRWRFCLYQRLLEPEKSALALGIFLRDSSQEVDASESESEVASATSAPYSAPLDFADNPKYRTTISWANRLSYQAIGHSDSFRLDLLSDLLNLLENSEDSNIRLCAATALIKLGGTTEQIADGLICLLDIDKSTEVHLDATKLLIQLSQFAYSMPQEEAQAIDNSFFHKIFSDRFELFRTVNDPNAQINIANFLLVKWRDSEAESIPDSLVSMLLDLLNEADNSGVQVSAAELLIDLNKNHREVIPILLNLLVDDEKKYPARVRAAISLWKIGNVSELYIDEIFNDLISGLIDLLKKEDEYQSDYGTYQHYYNTYRPDYGTYQLLDDAGRPPFNASTTLVKLHRFRNYSEKIEQDLDIWIEQHRNEQFVKKGIELLMQLVSY